MKRYTLDETRGDIAYEVDGDKLILRVSPHFMGSLPTDNYYLITTGDDTVPSDYNVFSAKRVMEEVGKSKSYWELTEAGILTPVGDYPVVSKSDVVAYAKASPVATAQVASTSTFGLVKVAVDDALVVKGGVISINKKALNGFDVNQLEEYLNNHGYVSSMTTLKGYEIAKEYQPIAESDTIVSALGKLERGVRDIQDDYVTIGTDQTIIGQKTFEKTIVGNSDVVAYATGSPIATTPVASTSTFGLVKVANDGVLVIKDGILSVNSSSVGLNEAHLKAYLTANEYATQTWVTNRGYLTSSALSGYATTSYVDGELSKYVTTKTFTSTLSGYVTTGTLESALGNYVTMWSYQTITGQKTFTKTIIGNADVVAYAKTSPVATAPVASTSTFGLVKVGSGVSVSGGVISVSGTGGGGVIESVSASIGSGVNNPSVSVTTGGTPTARTIAFYFNGLVGKQGNSVGSVSGNFNSASGATSTYTLYDTNGTRLGQFSVRNGNDGANKSLYSSYFDSAGGLNLVGDTPTLRLNNTNAGHKTNAWMINNAYGGFCGFYNSTNGTSNPCAQISTNGMYSQSSDERLKEVVEYVDGGVLDKIGHIKVFRFRWKYMTGGGTEYGLGAMSVRDVFPELTTRSSGIDPRIGDYSYSLSYGMAGAVIAVGGLKELYEKHKRLENEVRSLRHWMETKDRQVRLLMDEVAALSERLKGGGA